MLADFGSKEHHDYFHEDVLMSKKPKFSWIVDSHLTNTDPNILKDPAYIKKAFTSWDTSHYDDEDIPSHNYLLYSHNHQSNGIVPNIFYNNKR